MQAVRARSAGEIALGTACFYRHLARLKDEGLVAETGERPEDDDPRRGAYYRLTPRGMRALASGVVRLVLRRVVGLVLAGVAIGAALSWWASQFVSTLLYGLQPRDPGTFAAVGVFAGWLPARRAARIDPTTVLREG